MIAHSARDKYDIYVNQFYFKDMNSLFDRTVSLVWSVIKSNKNRSIMQYTLSVPFLNLYWNSNPEACPLPGEGLLTNLTLIQLLADINWRGRVSPQNMAVASS